jgi:hypothetical protein
MMASSLMQAALYLFHLPKQVPHACQFLDLEAGVDNDYGLDGEWDAQLNPSSFKKPLTLFLFLKDLLMSYR